MPSKPDIVVTSPWYHVAMAELDDLHRQRPAMGDLLEDFDDAIECIRRDVEPSQVLVILYHQRAQGGHVPRGESGDSPGSSAAPLS